MNSPPVTTVAFPSTMDVPPILYRCVAHDHKFIQGCQTICGAHTGHCSQETRILPLLLTRVPAETFSPLAYCTPKSCTTFSVRKC
eukprot:3351797-Pyramimonas_sp.AAC.1